MQLRGDGSCAFTTTFKLPTRRGLAILDREPLVRQNSIEVLTAHSAVSLQIIRLQPLVVVALKEEPAQSTSATNADSWRTWLKNKYLKIPLQRRNKDLKFATPRQKGQQYKPAKSFAGYPGQRQRIKVATACFASPFRRTQWHGPHCIRKLCT
jgi:hypothetical protein